MKIRPGAPPAQPGPPPAFGPRFSRDAARCSLPQKVERVGLGGPGYGSVVPSFVKTTAPERLRPLFSRPGWPNT
jgi:hypothetical protein